jgi:hypothetical protein
MKRAFAAPGSSVTAGSPIFRARMHGLSANGPVGSADGLPLARLIGEAVADPELNRQR